MGAAFQRFRIVTLSALIVALCAVAVTSKAGAQGMREDLSGRWVSERRGYVLDIARCGAEWCGVKLKDDKSCGTVALRLGTDASAGQRRRFGGTLTLDPAAQTYNISASFGPSGAERATELFLVGNPGPSQPLTRMIQFQDKLVRSGDVVCRAENKVSGLTRAVE